MKNVIKLILVVTSVLVIILLLDKHFPHALESDQNKASLISTTIVLVLFASRMSLSNITTAVILNQFLAWVVVGVVALSFYSYKLEIKQFTNRLIANLVPSYGQINNDNNITFYSGQNGHFNLNALVNNKAEIAFMLDTGASVVSLTYEDASLIGVDVENLKFNIPLSTANGLGWGASIKLQTIQIGPITVHDVSASVSQKNALSTSLLGMSFLKKLKKFIIQENKLVMQN